MGLFSEQFMKDQLQALPSASEVFRSFLDLSPADWMIIAGGIMWLVLLKLPLTAIDRRDQPTGLTYMVFMAAAGVILMIALPSRVSRTPDLTTSQLATIGVLAFVAMLRWSIRRRIDPRVVVVTKKKKEE